MSQNPIRIFDLESKLAEDADGAFSRQLRDELATELGQLKQQINAGLPPEEYQQASQYATALEKAAEVVDKIWSMEH